MKKKIRSRQVNAMRKEYDFRGGVRGKYAGRLRREGSNIVVLDQDVAEAFPDSRAVNRALRALLEVVPRRVIKRVARKG